MVRKPRAWWRYGQTLGGTLCELLAKLIVQAHISLEMARHCAWRQLFIY